MKDLRALPRVSDSSTYLYLERCKIEQDGKSICYHDGEGKVPVPCASFSMIMLGPGTSISHMAVKALADNGCMIVWCGEQGVRYYAHSTGGTRNAANLIKQAKLASIAPLRLKIVRQLYQLRFGEKIEENLTLQQIRGREGIRVRESYRKMSAETGVIWEGRNYDQHNWGGSDKINQALSTANASLYGLCHAAIVSLGYSPGLGFIHTGQQLSFVYDIADLYKTTIAVPAAFKSVASKPENLEREVRVTLRDYFKESRVLVKIVDDIGKLMNSVSIEEMKNYEEDEMLDEGKGGKASKIWDPSGEYVAGGVNYGEDDSQRGDGDGHNDT